ncbi:MAG: glycosyltransferase [Candidatus Pacearchaeota archaeon]
MRVALFHPWIKSKGGGEKVILEILKKSKHKIDVYTWSYESDKTFEEFRNYNIKVIGPKIARKIARLGILRGLLFPLGLLKKLPIEKYDLLLISTSGMGEFITFRSHKKGKTYAYVHTPLREADEKIIQWNLKNRYKGFFSRSFYLIATKIYKSLEKKSWKKLDVVIFNSKLSKKRAVDRGLIKKIRSHVINPPVDIKRFQKGKKTKGNYFIYISRLNPPKRQDVLVEAWKKFVEENPKFSLVIVGTPENRKYSEKLFRLKEDIKNLEIKTNVSDSELEKLIIGCRAGIFLGYQEDFGIVPLEIISAEKPLIAVEEGGYVDIIKDHPLFHRLKERHHKEEMVKEVQEGLEKFIKSKPKKKMRKLKINNFIEEIDNIISSASA